MLYFLYGDNAPLQIKYEELVNNIKNEFPNIKIKIFDAGVDEIEPFFSAISTNSMFASKELIILKRAESYKKLDNLAKSLKLYNLLQKEVIIVYEEILNDFGKRTNEINKKTLKQFEEIAKLICYRQEDEQKAVCFYIQEKLNISSGEAESLIELIGDDFFVIKHELEKIENFLDGERFSLQKVRPILSINTEENLKKLIESYLLTGEKDKLISYLRQEKIYMLFVYSIVEEILLYLKLKLLVEDGLNKKISYNNFKGDVYEKIKFYFRNSRGFIHPYPLFLKLKNIDLFNSEDLKNRLSEILKIEYNMKSGQGDIAMDLELFILKN